MLTSIYLAQCWEQWTILADIYLAPCWEPWTILASIYLAPCWEQWTILASGAKRSDRGGAYSGAPALHPYGIVSITP